MPVIGPADAPRLTSPAVAEPLADGPDSPRMLPTLPVAAPAVHDPAIALEARHLRAFVVLVEQGSVTDAARALGLAQSTVSEALGALERTLGTRVVARARGARAVRLTTAGEALLPHARAVLAALGEAHAAVARVAPDAQATVAVIASESVCTYLLPHAIAPLRARWPRTRFAVTVAPCPTVRDALATGAYDLGLVLDLPAGTTGGSVGVTQQLVSEHVPLVAFTRPDHPLQRGRATRRRHELLDYPLVISEGGGGFQERLVAWLAGDDLPAPPIDTAGTLEGVKLGVLSHPRAFGLLPCYAVDPDVRAGRLAALAVDPPPPGVALHAITSTTRPRHPAVEVLLEGVRARVAPGCALVSARHHALVGS